jgi:hypothetical protein
MAKAPAGVLAGAFRGPRDPHPADGDDRPVDRHPIRTFILDEGWGPQDDEGVTEVSRMAGTSSGEVVAA